MELTVRELKKACEKQIKEGNGDKKILLSDDNEGNGFHEMCYLFTPMDNSIAQLSYDFNGDILSDFVVLG